MIRLSLVGIGSGNLDQLTIQAMRTLRAADVILLPRKGAEKSALYDIRRQILAHMSGGPVSARLVDFDYPLRAQGGDYLGGVHAWHAALAEIWTALIATHAADNSHVALMIWGDPSLYDSTLRIAKRLAQGRDLEVRIVPGLSSLQLLSAAHGVALNEIGAAVQITTGRLLRSCGWPKGVSNVVVMLDGLAPRGRPWSHRSRGACPPHCLWLCPRPHSVSHTHAS
ncbi:MAG: precorrin-6A synthase (deacetylating) [Rhodobacteraceae bacterium]|nr:precorrin-6A synthase (deacetylating) [Paracoccaceae bacterium]